MTITYSIQKFDFFIDQFEELGPIDLQGAIDYFQAFPFSDQLKQAEEYSMTTCCPSITFSSDNGKTLRIWAEDDNGYYLHYENSKDESDFYVSNNILINPECEAVEDFIGMFFNYTIENTLNLIKRQVDPKMKDAKLLAKQRLIYSYTDSNKFKYLVWTILYGFFTIIILFILHEKTFGINWILITLLSISWIPGVILHLTYILKNHDAVVTVDTIKMKLIYEKGDQKIDIKRNDIKYCELNQSRSNNAPWSSYRYVWIRLKDDRQIIITNFITKPENIIESLNLNYSIDNRTIPFLPI